MIMYTPAKTRNVYFTHNDGRKFGASMPAAANCELGINDAWLMDDNGYPADDFKKYSIARIDIQTVDVVLYFDFDGFLIQHNGGK
jgi:hypothetical protein